MQFDQRLREICAAFYANCAGSLRAFQCLRGLQSAPVNGTLTAGPDTGVQFGFAKPKRIEGPKKL